MSLGFAVAIAIEVEHGRVLATAGGWIRLDSLGAVFLLATGLLYAMAAVFSVGYLGVDQTHADFPRFARRYFALLNLFGWSMLLVPLVADFGTLWVALELTTIISALLVAIDRTDAALEASWKYVLIASSGLGDRAAVDHRALRDRHPRARERVRAAVRPLHRPCTRPLARRGAAVLRAGGRGVRDEGRVRADAHVASRTLTARRRHPVSALLSGSLLSGAFYAILRFFQVRWRVGERGFAEHVLIVFGVISLVAASFFVLRQGSYKRLLAYSSIEHMGIIALGIGFGAPLAIAGALLHVITHASAKGLAFFGSGSLLRGYDTKEVEGVTGAGSAMPWTGPMFLAAALALSGLPLSGVFRSEFEIVVGGFARPQYVGVSLLLVFVNLAFFGVIWHAGRMVLSPQAAPGHGRAWWVSAAPG